MLNKNLSYITVSSSPNLITVQLFDYSMAINSIPKRALKAVYNDLDSSFETLHDKGNHETIHQAHLKRLTVNVFSCVNKESPEILHDLFTADIFTI